MLTRRQALVRGGSVAVASTVPLSLSHASQRATDEQLAMYREFLDYERNLCLWRLWESGYADRNPKPYLNAQPYYDFRPPTKFILWLSENKGNDPRERAYRTLKDVGLLS